MADPILIDYDLFRHVSERASSCRYEDVWIAVERDQEGNLIIKDYPEDPGEGDRVVYHLSPVHYGKPPQVNVANIGSGTTEVDLLQLKVPPKPPFPGGTYAADAVFWTQAAVEKFLIPYYASVYGDQADTVVQELLKVLKPDAANPNPAFAVAHLPSSEYVTRDVVPSLVAIRHDRLEFIGAQVNDGS